jgi:hypothetical protein
MLEQIYRLESNALLDNNVGKLAGLARNFRYGYPENEFGQKPLHDLSYRDFSRDFEFNFMQIGSMRGLAPYEAVVISRFAVDQMAFAKNVEKITCENPLLAASGKVKKEIAEHVAYIAYKEQQYRDLSIQIQKETKEVPGFEVSVNLQFCVDWFKKLQKTGTKFGIQLYKHHNRRELTSVVLRLTDSITTAHHKDPGHSVIAKWFEWQDRQYVHPGAQENCTISEL